MSKKQPHPNPPRKGGLKKLVDKMNESKDKHDQKSPLWGDLEGLRKAATRNPVEAFSYE